MIECKNQQNYACERKNVAQIAIIQTNNNQKMKQKNLWSSLCVYLNLKQRKKIISALFLTRKKIKKKVFKSIYMQVGYIF